MSNLLPPNKQLYYDQVWSLACEIPCGKVATYGQIAKLLPVPEGISVDEYKAFAARWVGLAMGACPDDVPWQRVVNSQGKISHQARACVQQQLLEAEGLLFSNEKINLDEYQWLGPGQADLQGRLF